MTITVLCAVAAIPAVLIVGCLRCRRSLNQPTTASAAATATGPGGDHGSA